MHEANLWLVRIAASNISTAACECDGNAPQKNGCEHIDITHPACRIRTADVRSTTGTPHREQAAHRVHALRLCPCHVGFGASRAVAGAARVLRCGMPTA